MAKKYIDADRLIRRLENRTYRAKGKFIEMVNEQPAADVVSVVRCKDCKWGRKVCGNIECFVDRNIPPEYHGYEWFCPNGERRTDE